MKAASAEAATMTAGAPARQARALRPRRATLPAMDGQAGFALLEVLISAVLVAMIVIATFTGFDASNRASADERSHAQADVLAQQDEDRLRSLQIDQLSGLSETRNVTYNGTVYTVTSTGEFLADSTESPSCVKEAGSASYVRTTSKVTWPALKSRPPVVETGLITPPIGGELLVQVFDANGAGVAGMTVQAKGPSPSTAMVSSVTGSNGCVIFSSLTEGEYSVTTFQTGYVDKDGNSEPPLSKRVASVTTGATTKKQFEFAQAGELKVKFVNSLGATSEGDQFLAYNTNMSIPWFRTFGTLGTYASTLTTPKTIFPFGSTYTVYAGACTTNKPSANGQPESSNPSVLVTPGGTPSVNVVVPPINIQVMSGKSSTEAGEKVTKFAGTIIDENCENKTRTFSTTTAVNGEFHQPLPYGSKYKLCVASLAKVGTPTAKFKKLKNVLIVNNTPAGTSLQTIYLGSGEEQTTSAYSCP